MSRTEPPEESEMMKQMNAQQNDRLQPQRDKILDIAENYLDDELVKCAKPTWKPRIRTSHVNGKTPNGSRSERHVDRGSTRRLKRRHDHGTLANSVAKLERKNQRRNHEETPCPQSVKTARIRQWGANGILFQ
ncbi:hypothetical protein R1flu_029149 [Riccia fluitans]|uniref:Uncharacterized protein n=1 Tax=Riccia fluitans TaxID=41844 RepID=A0ABD1XRK2_9MARC